MSYSPLPTSTKTSVVEPANPKRVLNVPQLVALSFFTVSGGPYGIEGIGAAAPPLFALLTFIVVPLIWSLPLSMITAVLTIAIELSCAIPEDGGCVLWISRAFGRVIGWTNAMCSWMVFLLDSALRIYPTVLLSYIVQFTGELPFFARWAICTVIVLIIMMINLRSAEEVGWISVFMTIIALFPFVLFIFVAISKNMITPQVWLETEDDRPWSPSLLLSLIIWNSTGWEDVGMFAGEVTDPIKVFPRAVLWSILLQTLSNVFPFAVGLCVASGSKGWKTGYFGTLAMAVGGEWLYYVILAGSMAAVILNSVLIALLTAVPFNYLMQADVLIACLSYFLLFATFVYLRFREPSLPRPFRLPGKHPIFSLLYIITPCTILILIMITEPWLTLVVGAGIVALTGNISIFLFTVSPYFFRGDGSHSLGPNSSNINNSDL